MIPDELSAIGMSILSALGIICTLTLTHMVIHYEVNHGEYVHVQHNKVITKTTVFDNDIIRMLSDEQYREYNCIKITGGKPELVIIEYSGGHSNNILTWPIGKLFKLPTNRRLVVIDPRLER